MMEEIQHEASEWVSGASWEGETGSEWSDVPPTSICIIYLQTLYTNIY